jgi:endonuclease I
MYFGSVFSPRARRAAASVRFQLALLALAATVSLASAQPASYFATAEGLSGEALKQRLEQVISTGVTTRSYAYAKDAHRALYEDPDDPTRLILFYSQASWDKNAFDPGSGSAEYWNREHLWPRSYGIGDSGPDNSDLFHLVPANKLVNNLRDNKYFDYSDPADTKFKDPAHSLAPGTTSDSDSWEPADAQKGWTARAMFYMDTRYSYLTLVDTPPERAPFRDGTFMAQLSVMLEWNRRFLPGEKEKQVNQDIFTIHQFNRNPYIDYPEFADAVWIEGPSWGGWRLAHFTLAELLLADVSGDHADPDGDGLPNLIEMARYSDPRSPDARQALEIEAGVAGEVTLSFIRASDTAHLNLAIVLESSPDLADWTPVDLNGATVTPLGDERESVSVTDALPPASPRFYRLRVERL